MAVLYLKDMKAYKRLHKDKTILTEYNKVASDKKAEEITQQEKDNTVATYVADKKTKINKEKQIKRAKKEETKKEEVKEKLKKKKQKKKLRRKK